MAKQKKQDIDKIKIMTQRYRKAEDSVSQKHKLWAELDMFDRGEQWKNASIPAWIPKPVTNYIRYVRQLKRANLASAISKAHFLPLNPQYAEQVEKLQKAYDHVWEVENVRKAFSHQVARRNAGAVSTLACNDNRFVAWNFIEMVS